MINESITFVVAVNDFDVYKRNFMASPILNSAGRKIRVLEKLNYSSASMAYNDALRAADTDLVIFVHQDIFLPNRWLTDLENALMFTRSQKAKIGVLGCYGVTRENTRYGNLYSVGLQRMLGAPFGRPAAVQTLDEIVLILRRSSGLRFDEKLSGFHLYGTDICMQATLKGMENYAIDAFCIHNSKPTLFLPKEFYRCYRYLRKKYWYELPIQTSCIRITRENCHYYRCLLDGLIARLTRRTRNSRHPDPSTLMSLLQREGSPQSHTSNIVQG